MDELEPIILLITGGILIRFHLPLQVKVRAKSCSNGYFYALANYNLYHNKDYFRNIALSLGMIGALY